MSTQIEDYETKDSSYCVTLEHIGVTFKNNAKILRDINLNIKKRRIRISNRTLRMRKNHSS